MSVSCSAKIEVKCAGQTLHHSYLQRRARVDVACNRSATPAQPNLRNTSPSRGPFPSPLARVAACERWRVALSEASPTLSQRLLTFAKGRFEGACRAPWAATAVEQQNITAQRRDALRSSVSASVVRSRRPLSACGDGRAETRATTRRSERKPSFVWRT